METTYSSSSPLVPHIVLYDMIQRREIRAMEEDWTGTTSSARRRKLQNRLNQRAYDTTVALEVLSDSPLVQRLDEVNRRACKSRCSLLEPGVLGALDQFIRKAYEDYMLGHPQPWQLSTIIQVNTIRALVCNAHALGVSDEWQRERAMSPFPSEHPWRQHGAEGERLAASCPPSLTPTQMQLEVPHRAWIDLFPIPQMRNNILQEYSRVDADELCADLLDIRPGLGDKPNLIVWGDAADPSSWEASTPFLRKWGWMLSGCSDVLEATNYWRRRRGESRLTF